MRLLNPSVNQRLPSGPAVMPSGKAAAVGMLNSVITPLGVMRPTRLPNDSVNQRLPSGPAAMLCGALGAVGRGNSVIWPVVVMLAIRSASDSVNHRFPSGPAVMLRGPLAAVGIVNSTMGSCAVAGAAWRAAATVKAAPSRCIGLLRRPRSERIMASQQTKSAPVREGQMVDGGAACREVGRARAALSVDRHTTAAPVL